MNKKIIAASILVISTTFAAPAFASCTIEPINHIVSDGAEVPVNVGGIPWAVNRNRVDFQVTLEDDAGTAVEFTIDRDALGLDYAFLIKPSDWAEGNKYRVKIESDGVFDEFGQPRPDLANLDVLLTVGAELPLPTQETDFDVSGSTVAKVVDNETNQLDGAYVDISATLPSYSSFYTYKTFVDGAEWFSSGGCLPNSLELGQTAYGPAKDRLTAMCGEFEPVHQLLEPGDHEVQIEIGIMGTTETLTTATYNVTISCGDETTGGGEETSGGDDDGCSTVNSGGSMLMLFGLLAFFRRRRA